MVFSSILFIFYFLPLTLLLYYAGPSRLRNLVLLVMSLAFYSWGEPVYVSIMLFSTIFDYGNGLAIEKCLSSGRKRAARAVLLLSVAGNLGILGFFKYSNFFIEIINAAGGTDFPLLELSLPIGISFYTFQTMSYTIDVYLGQAGAQKNLVQFGAYVAMFPQLVAGPIVKYKDISGQLADRNVTAERFSYGISRFITGLSKKVLLANNIGMVWEQISGGNLAGLSAAEAWIGAAAFSFQIYFDFFRVLRYGHRAGRAVQLSFSGKFQPSLPVEKHDGILAQMAYFSGNLVPGIRLYSSGRQQEGDEKTAV